MLSLYIHIPFCRRKCFYCSFVVSVGQDHRMDAYLDCLSQEAANYQGRRFASVYIGGGTPAYLGAPQLQRLFEIIRRHFTVEDGAEYTVEANPESLDE
ncbi:MAG: coproporphyrinogen III oxidase family protein, partial [Candidatus Omnitrophica bacterium]|nr:coproporphyrinogen III oxidase family protein [Candidatus Omnitrophota bacterium]